MNRIRALRGRPITSYNKIWLGSIALGLIATIIGVVLLIGALDLGRTRYHAEFARLLVTDYQHVLFVFFLCHLKNVLMGYL